MRKRQLGMVCAAALLWPAIVSAQLRATTYASGLSAPLAFVQDPADPANQYVVEQGGLIRLIRNGVVQGTPFLNLGPTGLDVVLCCGERGLLGLALPPDYGTSGRFYVNFTRKPDGHTVIARFTRPSTSPTLIPNVENERMYGFHGHFSSANCMLLFGGGIRKGLAYGRTADRHPMVPVEQPVRLIDLHATIYRLLGIPADMWYETEGRPFYATKDGKGQAIEALIA